MHQRRYSKQEKQHDYTVADLVDRYIAIIIPQKIRDTNNDVAKLTWWKNQLGYCLLSELTPALIAEKRERLLKEITFRKVRRSPATTNRYLASLSNALTIAVKEWGWLENSPMIRMRKLKEPRGRVRFLSEAERIALLKSCKQSKHPYLYVIAVLALSTGMRQAEILNLRWEDIDLDRGHILINESKNGDRRSVPLKGKALDLFKAFHQFTGQDFGLVFCSLLSKNKPACLRWFWNKALKESGVKNFRFHDMRHSAASYLAMSGATPSEIAEVLGHRTLAMVKRYAHISDHHSAGVVERMNKKFFG